MNIKLLCQAICLSILSLIVILTPQTVTAKAMNPKVGQTVIMEDNLFSPRSITVNAGQKVTWVNRGSHIHNVKSSAARFNSGDIAPGKSFSYVFTKPGRYSYLCTHHTIFGFGMRGEVIVR